MKIGYARVSTNEQNLDLQIDALKAAGCDKLFTDKIGGSKANRPGLEELLTYARSGDEIVVWRLDRFGRSLRDLIDTINNLQDKGIEFQSLQEKIDTKTSSGKLIFHIFASLAEFERNIIRERTNAGLQAARARGKMGGRPKGIPDQRMPIVYAAESLYKERKLSVQEICKRLNISKATLYKYLKSRDIKVGNNTLQSNILSG
jgi:DNA invertase Pin-like site-specific DNA recombinase